MLSLQCFLILSLIIHVGHVFNPQVFNLPAGTDKFCTFVPQLISSSVWIQVVTSRMSMSHISLSHPVTMLMSKDRGFSYCEWGKNNFSPAGLSAGVNPLGFLKGSPRQVSKAHGRSQDRSSQLMKGSGMLVLCRALCPAAACQVPSLPCSLFPTCRLWEP